MRTDPAAAAGGPGAGEQAQAAPTMPAPPSERRAWLIACVLCVLGAAVLASVLTGLVGRTTSTIAPPPVPALAGTPAPAAHVGRTGRAEPVAERSAARPTATGTVAVSRSWIEGFYPIYAAAQHAFAVNWLLLASIHRQESAFSTAPGTYSGLNFAGCCGGPMQFNVRNGRVSTWDLVSDSYRYARRPAGYDHMTARHPSIYDDFDAIMAAAHLLSADGAGYALDGSAWTAAYDYYGHDLFGVLYADQVLARAIAWSQHGFCVQCAEPAAMVEAVDAAYGAPVRARLLSAGPRSSRPRARPERASLARRAPSKRS